MREPYGQIYLHCVWSTWDRLPLITSDVERRLYSAIIDKCRELRCIPIRIGGIQDHLHLLVRLRTTIAVAILLKEVKGSSSHLMTHEIKPSEFFKWQGAYGVFSLRSDDVPIVKEYIMNQRAHHAANTVRSELEKTEIADEAELNLEELPDDEVIGESA